MDEQTKQLNEIYQQRLFELQQAHLKINEKLAHFKQNQRNRLEDINQRLFNSTLNKQISIEQLHQLKTIIEQLQEEFRQFQTDQFKIDMNLDCNNAQNSRLNAYAKPFEYVPSRLFDGCAFPSPIHPVISILSSHFHLISFLLVDMIYSVNLCQLFEADKQVFIQ